MRILMFLSVFFFVGVVVSQDSGNIIRLPNAIEIKQVEFSNSSMFNWYDAETLMKLLPRFTPASGTYNTKAIPFQYGKFNLKNGRVIRWMANSAESILLTEDKADSRAQLFMLPKSEKPDGPIFKIWKADGSDAYIDINGNRVPAPIKSDVREYSEGLIPIKVGDKFGYSNEKGEIVIKPRWPKAINPTIEVAGQFHDGLAAVIEEFLLVSDSDVDYATMLVKCGHINKRAEYIFPPKFRLRCGNFSDGVARIEVDWNGDEYEKGKGGIGFINTKGEWLVKPQFFSATDFKDGFALVQSELRPTDIYIKMGTTGLVRDNTARKSLYLIDKTGKRAVGIEDCRWRYDFADGLALTVDETGHEEFINEQCETVFKMPTGVSLGGVTRFAKGLLPAYKTFGDRRIYGYLDRTGKTAIAFRFAEAELFSDGVAGVEIKEKGDSYNAYIGPVGNVVLSHTRGRTPFINGLAFQYLYTWTIAERPDRRNIRGYMNKKGKYVWLSPRAEVYMSNDWLKENYIGPDNTFRR